MINKLLFALAFLVMSSSAQDLGKSLFNGKDLTGWSGDNELWKVENGIIAGSTFHKKIPSNRFLSWQGDVGDFELTFKAKVEGDNNSGVMYRAEKHDKEKFRLKGNQCDIHPKPEYCGMLYSQATGRNIIVERGNKAVVHAETGKPEVIGKTAPVTHIDISKWQTYKIVAKGNLITHYVNGELAIELTDNHPEMSFKGILALQLHRGKPMKVFFKDIYLKKLN